MSNTKSRIFACMAIVLLSITAIQATFETTPNERLPITQTPPTLSSPADGATNVGLSPTFRWNGGLINATFEIYEGNTFEPKRNNLDLGNYVAVDSLEVINTEDLSGITYVSDENLLYMITNKPSAGRTSREIIITDLNGEVIRTITLSGWNDTEDIVHLGGNNFAIIEEDEGRVYFVDIFPTTSFISKSGKPSVRLFRNGIPWTTFSGDGIEGISYDVTENRIYVVDEKRREIHCFNRGNSSSSNTLKNCSIATTLSDLSGIYHPNQLSVFNNFDVDDHFLLLSHESNTLIEVDPNCNRIYSQRTLPRVLPSGRASKFEGVTMDKQGNLYLVSEFNWLYIYKHENKCHLSKEHTEDPIHQGLVNGTSYNLPISLKPNTDYVWRIKTDEGCSEFSSFRTAPPICGINATEIGTTCDDNCTPNNLADDTFTITVSATVENGSGFYTVSHDMTTSPSIPSGESFEIGPFATNTTADIELTFRDSADTLCDTIIIVSRIAPCSESKETTVETPVSIGIHDAHEGKDGTVILNSALIPMGDQINIAAFIFRNADMGIPKGARITSAVLQFTAGATAIEPATFMISMEKNSSVADFNADFPNNITNRPMVNGRVQWEVEPWSAGQRGDAQQSPNISNILQEIVNRSSFGPNSNIGIYITGTSGNRVVQARENGVAQAPELIVKYTTCPIAGTPCDDGDPNTVNDTENGECCCKGCPPVETPCRTSDNLDGIHDGQCNCIIPNSTTVVTYRIASPEDDVEENGKTGSIASYKNKLRLVSAPGKGNQVIGLRFTSINIPAGAQISNAYLEFVAESENNRPGTLMISVEDINNSPPFKSDKLNVSSREKIANPAVLWEPETWEEGRKYRTENLADFIQELVNKADWQEENTAITFIIEGTGRRVAKSYENPSEEAPALHIEYTNSNIGTQGTNINSDRR